jgi:5-methylcytosine-specific restriction endonuclease McrA
MATRHVTINGRRVIDPRQTRAWRRLRDQVVSEEPTCRLGFPGICTTVSTTADHVRPVVTHPELALERSNCRGACKSCNEARRTVPDESLRLGGNVTTLTTTRAWRVGGVPSPGPAD